MEHLLSTWPDLLEQIQRADNILLLSDYDGTLTPIVDRPEAADISDDTRQLLIEIASRPRFKLGIVSGRSLTDLKNKVNINGIAYAGNHGFEIDSPGFSFTNPIAKEIKPVLKAIRQMLTMAVSTIRGVLVEDKGLTLSVHYRQVEVERVPEIQNIVENTINRTAIRGIVKMTPGKKVYEIRPAVPWDKGQAIRLLMKRFGQGDRRSGLLPIYIGDDLTDEDGFKIMERSGYGISIRVGGRSQATAARYYLNSPEEVGRFLEILLEGSQRNLAGDDQLDVPEEFILSDPVNS